MSKHNTQYNEKFYAVKWKEVPATAPGYNKGLACLSTKENLFGEHGYFTEIRKVTDFDGTVPWWPIQGAKKYGETKRNIPGKSAWFSGVYSVLFVHKFLGLDYDNYSNTLSVAPLNVLGNYNWQNLKIGSLRADVSFKKEGELILKNKFSKDLNVIITLPQIDPKKAITVNGQAIEKSTSCVNGGIESRKFELKIPSNKEIKVSF